MWTLILFIICTFFILYILSIFGAFFSNFLLWKSLWSFVYVDTLYVGAGITSLMSFSGGETRTIFRRKMETARFMEEKMDGEMFISHLSRKFSFIDKKIRVILTTCTLSWLVNNYVSRQGKGIYKRNVSTIVSTIWHHQLFVFVETDFSVIIEQIEIVVLKLKNHFSFHSWQTFSLRIMATLRRARRLAAVSRETPEITRYSQSPNTVNPGIAEEYITPVSAELEGRVTKNFSQEFRRTECRILGALSKPDKNLLDPLVRTRSRTVPGMFRNSNVENQEPHENRSQEGFHREVGPSVNQSCHSIASDPNEALHMEAGIQEVNPYCSMGELQKNKRRRAPQVINSLAVRIPCDNWSRPNFVGHSAVSEQQQLRQHQ